MHDRSMQSGIDLAWEIQLTDWSTAVEQSKLVFVVSTKPSQAQFISLFTMGKNCLLIVQITHQFLSRPNNFFFLTSIQFVACALRENLSNWSSVLQIPHDICTCFECYLYSMKCSWIIKCNIILESLIMNVRTTIIIITFIKAKVSINNVHMFYLQCM